MTTLTDEAEAERVAALRRYGALDTPVEASFDELTELAAQLCQSPMALVTLVDDHRQWFKSRVGFELRETSREASFCAHALGGPAPFVVEDTTLDPRFRDNPLVTGDPNVRFYAGAPLVVDGGHVLGTLCVLDVVPRTLSNEQLRQLQLLARQVVSRLELNRQAEVLASEVAARAAAEAAFQAGQRVMNSVLDHTDVLVYAKDLEGRFILANSALQRLLPGPPEVLGATDHDLFSASVADLYRMHDQLIVSTGGNETFAEDLVHPDGAVHGYVSTKFPLLDEHGGVYAVAGVSTDVTELTAEREAHAEAEHRWQALVESSPTGVAVIGDDGRIVYANPQALLLYGATAEQLLGLPAADFADEHEQGDVTSGLLTALTRSLGPMPPQRRLLRKLDGQVIPVEVTAAVITYSGRPALQIEIRDMSVQDAADRALRESERRFRSLFEDSPVGSAECLPDGTLVSVNPELCRMFGYTADELVGQSLTILRADPHDLALFIDRLIDGSAEATALSRRLYRRKDGTTMPVLTTSTQVRDDQGHTTRLLGNVIDVTSWDTAEQALRASEYRFRTMFVIDPAGLAVITPAGKAVQVNPALAQLLGTTETALLDAADLITIAIDGHDRDEVRRLVTLALTEDATTVSGEMRLRGADAGTEWAAVTVTALPDPQHGGSVLLQLEDITARKNAEQRLTHQALYDSLTGLPNRSMLVDRIGTALARRDRRPEDGMLAVLFCDLDGFKLINDSYGHAAGDAVLMEIGHRLLAGLRPTDTVARLGGDEFVMLCENIPNVDAITVLAGRLSKAIAAPISWNNAQLLVTASVGISFATSTSTADELIRTSDTAMYRAKVLGKDRYETFDEDLRARSTGRVAVEAELRGALERDRVEVYYQPIFSLPDKLLIAVEALARIRTEDGTLLLPDAFIPVAEDTGLIVPLGEHVLTAAANQLAVWRRDLAPNLRCSVNISAKQASRPDLVDTIRRVLAATGLPSSAVAIELTESALLEAARSTVNQLQELRDLGVEIGIDDFGTGYASLQYLRRLPVTFLKVDRSFVSGTGVDEKDNVIVQTVIRLAHDLQLDCIVEGIETEEQLAKVLESGAWLQGYYFSKPVAAEAMTALIRSSRGL